MESPPLLAHTVQSLHRARQDAVLNLRSALLSFPLLFFLSSFLFSSYSLLLCFVKFELKSSEVSGQQEGGRGRGRKSARPRLARPTEQGVTSLGQKRPEPARSQSHKSALLFRQPLA